MPSHLISQKMEMMKLLVKIIIVFVSINSPAYGKVISKHPELDARINDVNYGRLSERHLNMNTTDTSINPTNATPEITLSESNINSLTAHMPLRQQRTLDQKVAGVRSFLHGAKRTFKKWFMHYAHYGPEIGFCSCMAKYAWFNYPIVPEVTYGALGQARHFMQGFMEDFMRGFVESQYDHNHQISSKMSLTTADDYFDYQNKVDGEDYGPSRRIGHQEDFYPDQNHRVIEKADPKLISIVEMLKNLQPKVNQNDSFIIRYARALDAYTQEIYDAKRKSTVSGDKIKKYRKNDLARQKMTETSVGAVNSSSINGTGDVPKGRSMSYQYSNNINRRVLVPGVPSGLPSFSELPPADYTYVKNNVVHHIHDLRSGKFQRNKRGGYLAGEHEKTILSWLGFPPPGRGDIGPTVQSCAKGYAWAVVLRHIHMLLFK